MAKIAKNIKSFRSDSGFTQDELAEAIGVTHQSVSKWENGSALPDLDSLVDIAHLFVMTLDQLINNEEEEDSPRPRVRKSGFFANLIDDDVIDSIKSAAGILRHLGLTWQEILPPLSKAAAPQHLRPHS